MVKAEAGHLAVFIFVSVGTLAIVMIWEIISDLRETAKRAEEIANADKSGGRE